MTLKGRRGRAGERKMTKHLGVCQAEGEGFRCEQPHKDENLFWFFWGFFLRDFGKKPLQASSSLYNRGGVRTGVWQLVSSPNDFLFGSEGWKLERRPSDSKNISIVPRPTCACVFARVLSESLFECSAPAWQDTRGIPQNATYHLGCCLFPPARNTGRCHFLCVCRCVCACLILTPWLNYPDLISTV